MTPSAPASPAYDKLISLLRELFQLDQPDLDFGLYRVLHARAAEIDKFLSQDLLPQVRKEFAHYQPADKAAIQKDLAQAIAQAEALEMDPEASPKVKNLRHRLASEAVDLGGLEREVFDHLHQFFRRYYAEGDFLAKRVYKEGTYAIPYEGEEVKLHWANRDQYYIKTSEYLRDYAFRLRPTDKAKPMRVHFRLAEVVEGEHHNVKAAEGKDRVFILRTGAAAYELDAKTQELTFFFEYRSASLADRPAAKATADEKKAKPPTQKELLQAAFEQITALATDTALAPWLAELTQSHTRADGSASEKTRLQVNLERYTCRNTFDYFIHKDLGGFLRRELDFYLKNEVLHLDNIEQDTAPRVEQFLSKLRVLRKVAHHLIDFLAQLEDFQRKLWLKKKFVVDTQWCVTLDKIPPALLPEVAANAAQRQEWVELFGIEALAADAATPGYSEPLTVGFLQAYPHLVLDTRHFPAAFTERLLAGLDGNLDELTDGLLIHGENFQALNLLQERYKAQIRCIAIDPPYNTGSDGFPYKDNYQHSSWLTMMYDRLNAAWPLLREDGALFSNIDENERDNLQAALDLTFGQNNRVEELVWAQNTTHSQSPLYSTNHEYVEVYARDKAIAERIPTMFREPKPGFAEMMELAGELNPTFPPLSEISAAISTLFKQHVEEFKEELRDMGLEYDEETKKQDPWRGLYNYNNAEYRSTAGELIAEENAAEAKARIWLWREDNTSAPAQKQADSTRDADSINYRFYKPLHPKTGKPTLIPKTGWRYPQTWPDANRDSFESLDKAGRIAWGDNEKKVPQYKRFLHEVESNVAKSFFHDYTDGEKQLAALFGSTGLFPTPKPTTLPARFISQVCEKGDLVIDFFAGSGTTGHAVMNLNREHGSKLGFILVEASGYFDDILLPRLKKVAYTPNWKDGIAQEKPTIEETARGPKLLKVIRLESYEDTLNNLKLQRAEPVQTTLFPATDTPAIAAARQDYVLRYLLDVESRGSRSLLDVPAFRDPTAYTLDVKAPGSDQTEPQAVDLLETFNYLLGLHVHQVGAPQTLVAEFEHADHVEPGDGAGRLRLKGPLRKAATGPWWVRPVTGTLADGRRVLIIWRKLTADAAQDNLVLNAWFEKHDYSVRDTEFDFIYVNGDNNLENLRQPDETWKVQLIEEAFHRLLFAE